MYRRARGPIGRVLGLATALVLALSIAIVPAFGDTVQDESPPIVTVFGQGQLITKGVAVDLTVEFDCIPGVSLDWFAVTVRERFGRKIAMGSDWLGSDELPTCDGSPHYADLRVLAYDTPFKPGKALVTMEIYGSVFGEQFFLEFDQEIRLAKNAK